MKGVFIFRCLHHSCASGRTAGRHFCFIFSHPRKARFSRRRIKQIMARLTITGFFDHRLCFSLSCRNPRASHSLTPLSQWHRLCLGGHFSPLRHRSRGRSCLRGFISLPEPDPKGLNSIPC